MKCFCFFVVFELLALLVFSGGVALSKSPDPIGDYEKDVADRIRHGWSLEFGGRDVVLEASIAPDGSLIKLPRCEPGFSTRLVSHSGNLNADLDVLERVESVRFACPPRGPGLVPLEITITVNGKGEVYVSDPSRPKPSYLGHEDLETFLGANRSKQNPISNSPSKRLPPLPPRRATFPPYIPIPIAPPPLSVSTQANGAMGNVAPYRKDLLMRIGQHWDVRLKLNPIVSITLRKDGYLERNEILQSSGNKRDDQLALGAIAVTKFAPLPDWYKGERLTFRIELSKVAALQSSGSTSDFADRYSDGFAKPIHQTIEQPVASIELYRKDMMERLDKHWKSAEHKVHATVLITIGKDGHLVNREMIQASGSNRIDREILDGIGDTAFAPLPSWYQGDELLFRIDMNRLEAIP